MARASRNFFGLAAGLLIVADLFGGVESHADTVHSKERKTTEVAPGVYVIRHKDTISGFPNGNTEVIIGTEDVLVVDSAYLASEAREDVAQIRRWTGKPVRYLVNTHWHNDHTMGNGVYVDAFPRISVVVQTETKEMMRGYLGGWLARHKKARGDLQKELAAGKGANGKPLTEAERKEAESDLAAEEQLLSEHPNFVPRLPDTTFDKELELALGQRIVQLKYLGRGNTPGDAVTYLPAEQILIAGDLVVHPVPFCAVDIPRNGLRRSRR